MHVAPCAPTTLKADNPAMKVWRPSVATARHAQGFTLIELVMVIVLIGVLAVFVVPRVNLIGGFDEVGYRDKVRGALEFARKTAVAQRRNVQVTLAGNNLNLRVANDVPEGANGASFTDANSRVLVLPAPDRLCGGAVNQVCAPANVTLAGPADLTFSPLGRPSAGGGVYTVTGVPPAFTITVEAETGHVR